MADCDENRYFRKNTCSARARSLPYSTRASPAAMAQAIIRWRSGRHSQPSHASAGTVPHRMIFS
ncbi:hypothetical protein D3C78_1982210 [compost metagenome]